MSRGRRIALPDLLKETGYKQRDLWDLRHQRLFPFVAGHGHPTGRRGSASDYPAEALDYLRHLADVQQQFPRNRDEWVWSMWLDPADWPIDIRAWVLRRLDRALGELAREKAKGGVLDPGAERQLPGAGRMRNARARRAAWDWTTAWIVDNERPDLYSVAPEGVSELSFYDLLIRLLGPEFGNVPVFRFGGVRERISERGGPYWLARLQRFVAIAPDRYIEQARRDWRAICYLIELAERVDWNKAPPLIVFGTKAEPPSWVARKARRVRRKPPPAFVSQLIERWRHSTNFRAYVFSVFLVWRRLCARTSMPQLPDIIIGIVRQLLEALPKNPN